MHRVIQATVHCYCCTLCPAVCVSVCPVQDGSELPLKEVATGENVHSLLCILDTLIVRRHCTVLLLMQYCVHTHRHRLPMLMRGETMSVVVRHSLMDVSGDAH